jgi:hypothetical protein
MKKACKITIIIYFILKIIHYKGMPQNLVKPITYGSLHTKKTGGSGIT